MFFFSRVSKVTVEILEFGSCTYVVLSRLVVYRSTLAYAKKLAGFYGVQTGHSTIRSLVLYAVLETDDLADYAREQDVILMQVTPRLSTPRNNYANTKSSR